MNEQSGLPEDRGLPADTATPAAAPPPPPKMKKKRRWLRALLITMASLAVLVGTALLLVQFVFADDLLSFTLRRIEKKTGLRITYSSAEISPLRGYLTMRDVKVERSNHPAGEAYFTTDFAEVQIGILSLLTRELTIEYLRAAPIKGRYERIKSTEGRRFVIRDLQLQGASLELVDRSTPEAQPVAVKIDYLSATEIHRDTLLWDLLLRSNAKGRINHSVFEADSKSTAYGGVSTWTLPRIEAADLFARRLPPNTTTGACTLKVEHRFDASVTSAKSSWKVSCDGLGLQPTASANPQTQTLLGKAAAWLAEKPRGMALSFDLDVDPNHFSGGAAGMARPLLHAAGKSAVQALLADYAKRMLIGAGEKLLEKARLWRSGKKTEPVK